jgi:predicted  nucleic acid-binding Zn-ribbon protein
MSWIETLTKEAFQGAVRDAVRPDIEGLKDDIKEIQKCMGDIEQRVSRLEGAIEGSMRAYEANMKAIFSEFKVDVFKKLPEHYEGVHKEG